MLKMIVPTPAHGVPPTVSASASIENTSSSGRLKRTALFQLRPSSSSHWPLTPLNLTMRPTSGCGAPKQFVFGAGRPPGLCNSPAMGLQGAAPEPPLQTTPSESGVVWLPEWKTAA
jgi:hypothetical protein